jgi:hypothetical protein
MLLPSGEITAFETLGAMSLPLPKRPLDPIPASNSWQSCSLGSEGCSRTRSSHKVQMARLPFPDSSNAEMLG